MDTFTPRDQDVDVYGSTDPGRVRKDNQDHFLVASLHRRVRLHHTNLAVQEPALTSPATSYLLVVADGLGGHLGGAEASRLALATLLDYLVLAPSGTEQQAGAALAEAVTRAHHAVQLGQRHNDALSGMATTLTAALIAFPVAHIAQVGDSRGYRLRAGRIERLTRDQTLAQQLVEEGHVTETGARRIPYAQALTSAVGSERATPVIGRVSLEWEDVLMVCSDGLTKHVDDEEIGRVLAASTSSQDAARNLVALALERGGTDNVSVVVWRLHPDPRTYDTVDFAST